MQAKTLFYMQMLLSHKEHCAPRLPIWSVLRGEIPFGGPSQIWTVMQPSLLGKVLKYALPASPTKDQYI